MVHFFDFRGNPAAYCDDGVHIYYFSGTPAGYIEGDSVFDYEGRHLGWYENGWVVGDEGKSVYFTEAAQGGLPRPLKRMPPLKNMKFAVRMKKMRMMKPLKPMRSAAWAEMSGRDFFSTQQLR